MSEHITDTFKFMFRAGKFLAKGHILKREDGARFSKAREQKKIINNRNNGLLIDGKASRLSTKDSYQHLAVIAKPGGGKTTGYIVPNILDKANQRCSMLVTDPSGEIYQKTSKFLKDRGFNIVRLNPGDLNDTSTFNPFENLDARNIIEIEQICSSIILSKYGGAKDPIWNDGAISLLEIFAKCLAYGSPEYLNLPNLNYLIQLFGEDGSDLDDWVIEHSQNPYDKNDNSIFQSWIGTTKNNERMLSSYSTIVKTALKQLNNRQLQRLLATNDIDFKSFRKKKTIIYINIPENQQQYYQFIIDVFYSRFFSVMMEKEPKNSDLDVYCFLDEFGNAYVNNFQTIINNIRKYRVSLSIVLQGISQLDEKYSNQVAKSIKSGISSYMIFAGADFETAQEQNRIIGKKVLIHREKFGDVSERYQEIDLLPPEKLRTLKDNQVLFLSKNHHPFIVDVLPYYKNSRFLSYVKKGNFNIPRKPLTRQWKQLFVR